MTAWLLLLGAMLIWLAHFSALYAISSLVITLDASAAIERWSVAIVTAAAAVANLILLAATSAQADKSRAGRLRGFTARVAAFGASISLLAVLWQGLPAIAFSGGH